MTTTRRYAAYRFNRRVVEPCNYVLTFADGTRWTTGYVYVEMRPEWKRGEKVWCLLL